MKNNLVAIFLLWVCQSHLLAQSYLVQYHTLSPDDGLAGSTVYYIQQSDDGTIWLATSEGVQQYDGYRFRTFKAAQGLRAPYYQYLLNVQGQIWAISRPTRPEFIDIINPATQQIQTFESVFPNCPVPLQDIFRFAAGPDRSVFLIAKTGDIYHFDGQFRRYRPKDPNFLTKEIFCPNDSTIWLVGSQRWYEGRRYAELIERYDTIEVAHTSASFSWENGIFLAGKTDESGNEPFYFKKWGTRTQTTFQLPGTARPLDLTECYAVNRDHHGWLWFWNKGKIHIFDSFSGYEIATLDRAEIVEKTGHTINNISCIRALFDLNNLAWLPTNQGVLVVSIAKNNFQAFLNNQSISTRGMAALDHERVLTATYKGLKMLNLERSEVVTDFQIPYRSLIGVLYESPVLWAGVHESKLLRYDLNSGQERWYFFPQKEKQDLQYAGLTCYRDSKKRLWVGTEKGLLRLDEARDTLLEWTPLSVAVGMDDKKFDVRQLVETAGGIWIVTSRGLYLNPADTEKITAVGQLVGENLYHLYIDNDGIFWMGTRGNGVLRWDSENNNLTRLTDEQGLSNNIVYSIYEDKNGQLWMSTNAGLNVLNKKDLSIQAFFTRDGLTNNEFNFTSHLQMPDGRLLFGGIDGLVAFYPEQLPVNRTRNIPMYIWNIQRNNPVTGKTKNLLAEFQVNGKITIPPSENNMYVEFALLDLFNPAANRYAWFLEGVSSEWQYIHESYLRFNSLPYGSYQLRIRGVGSDGVSSTQELVIPLDVQAPYYMKPAFWLIAALATAVLIFGIFRLRTRELRQAKARLERLVSQRTADIEAQKAELEKLNSTKDQLFAIIGHELRNPVMQLQDFSEKVDYLVKKGETSRLKVLSDHFGQTIANVREILENLLSWGKMQSGRQAHKPQQFELQLVTHEIIRQARQLAELKNIHFQVDEEAPLYVFADPGAVGIILRNLLHNAMKFTPRGGEVVFSSKKSGKEILLEVKDSGVGMDAATLAKLQKARPLESRAGTGGERGTGLGLSLCHELVSQDGGQIDFESTPGKGTVIRVRFLPEASP